MSEVVYSTINDDDTGELFCVSVPYDPFDLPSLSTEEQADLARCIHAEFLLGH